MMWMSLLKSEVSLGLRELQTLLFMESAVDSLVNEIEEKGMTKGTKELFRKIREGEEPIEELHSVYAEIYDLSLEDYKKNFQKLLDASPPLQFSDVEPILDEAISLGLDIQDPNKETTEADEDNFQELSKKVKELSNVSDDTMLRNPIIRRKLRVFRELDKRWLLTFKKIPSDSTEKAEFDSNLEEFSKFVIKTVSSNEEIRLGRISNNGILTNSSSSSEFSSILQKNEEIKAFFEEKMLKYEPNLEGAEQYSEVIGQLDSADVLAAKGVTFTAKQNLTGDDITNYLDAIRKIPKSIENFVPDYVNNRKLPKNTFLTKESLIDSKTGKVSARKSLSLNPYADAIINNTYKGKEWIRALFETVRMQKVVPKSTLKVMLLDDIASAVRDNKGIVRDSRNYSPKYDFNVDSLMELELSDNPETAREQLSKYMSANTTIQGDVNSSIESMQNNALLDKSLFTYAESQQIKQLWEDNEGDSADGEHPFGDLEITLIDSNSNVLTPEEQQAIGTSGGTSRSIFAKIEIEDEEYDRKQLIGFLQSAEIKTPDSLETGSKLAQIYDISTEISQNPFVDYLLSVPSEQLNDIINSPQIAVTNVAEKLEPIKSLAFLSKIGSAVEGSNRGLVKETLKKLVSEDDDAKKREIATELNDKMEDYIADVKKVLISGFQTVLDDFAENWATKTWGKRKGRVMDAINQFKATSPPLLTGGDV